MFNKLFKKKTSVYQPVSGTVISLQEVDDEVFSSEMMGIGFAVRPDSSEIVSPIAGTIDSIFPTKHAFTMKGPQGIELLVHIGTDTVELNGEGFELLVKAGDQVAAQQSIMNVDFKAIKEAGKGTEVMVVFPNLEKNRNEQFDVSNQRTLVAEL
ncbi:sugar permease [Enterococcus florum]|uniref:Sugar permease n=1 Tax=Enterococcus florum TaxID=2480627 RepID=A0A4V0WPS4_9ENTE|nr:PTS glucose transporter subunit IIA [Enterococcus florum]GCF94869.1 sugar permease [Enterococcus florum]